MKIKGEDKSFINEFMNINKEDKQIESILKNVVKKSIINTIEEAQFFFYDESEVHGYFRCQLQNCFKMEEQLKDKTDLILRECKTKLLYHRNSGTNNGIKYLSIEYNNLIKLGSQPKSGYLDFAIWNPKKEFYNEGRQGVKKIDIGVEIKRQKKITQKTSLLKML